MKIRSKRYRLTKKGKANIKRFLLLTSLIITFLMLFTPFETVNGINEMITRQYIVRDGDTLWAIAENICPPSENLQQVLLDIKHLNGMEKCDIYAGQGLKLPIY